MSDQLYETLKQTAIAHFKGYESPTPWNNEAIQQHRTPECVHYLHPVESIPAPFNEPIKIDQFSSFMHFFGACLDRFSLPIKDLVVDVRQRTVVARLGAVFDFRAFGNEAKEEGYTAEYMVLMEMEESGTKVVRIEEFIDPQRLMGYVQPKAQRYAQSVSGGA
ncbi:hypothetical protein EV356DRAFT_498935 [Viridothelium virens]|uniref:SnoaL-like domain-containing protein n=1 Tax=Viridothelium virens TaxID=1048519 RepID=A0A6A6HDM0_VIRVR|nr:hypothetical protein EV356DRAFT_498935 [Viridothelium virens]